LLRLEFSLISLYIPHPDVAMKLADSKNENERQGFLKFYKTLTEEEVED
jgi:hypothetical protein